MEIGKMTFEEIESRLSAILSELEADDADIDALDTEARELQERRTALEQRAQAQRELRERIASAPARVIDTITPEAETRQEEEKMEFRNSPAYLNAYAEALKSDDWSEVRALITENGGGDVQVPDIVADKIETAWENDDIMRRITRVFVKGNYTIGYEISGTDAVIHVEGTAAPDEEELVLGKVTLVAANVKKWISVSDEVMDLKGQAFIDYLYDELAYRIVRKAAGVVIASILAAAADGGSTMPYVGTLKAALGATTVVDLEALLSDEATELVAIMNRGTYAALRGLQISSGVNVGDVFDGVDVVFTSELKSTTDNSIAEDDPYMIVGDLKGITANFPNGDEIKYTFDEYTLAPEDLVRIIGRLFVGLGVTKPLCFAVALTPEVE